MSGPRPRTGISEVELYVPGASPPQDGFKLSSNENPRGCSKNAQKAYLDAASNLAAYPDGGANRLRDAIAKRYGLDRDGIICGAGSDEIFQLLGQAYLSPGDNIVQSEHAFLVYRLVAQQCGAEILSVPDENFSASIDGMLNAITDRTKIVFLANPNNPTGTYLPYEDVRRLHAGLRSDILLVLDGAYAEYVMQNDYSPGFEMAGSTANVLVTRTFSKIHGLAALRLGWAYGHRDIIDNLNRVRGPFNVSAPAQAAGLAAIEDDRFVADCVSENADERARVEGELSAMGLKIVPSEANFLLVSFESFTAGAAQSAYAHLKANKIIVRDVSEYGLARHLRVSIGTPEANAALIKVMGDFVAAQS